VSRDKTAIAPRHKEALDQIALIKSRTGAAHACRGFEGKQNKVTQEFYFKSPNL